MKFDASVYEFRRENKRLAVINSLAHRVRIIIAEKPEVKPLRPKVSAIEQKRNEIRRNLCKIDKRAAEFRESLNERREIL
jgi:hypothetical protein